MFSYLITGAGRGLGLELTKQLRQRPPSEVSAIFATIRGTPSETLQELVVEAQGRIVIVHLVVTEKEGIAAAVDQVKEKLDGRGLDVLINNAVITETSPDGAVSMGALRETLQVNVEAGHEVTVAFLALLREGREKKVLNLSSSVGSIALARLYAVAPHPAYKISKAALNNLTAQYALELEKDGFTFVVVSPGWLKTDMGGEYAQLDVSVGASAVLDVIARDGKELRFRGSSRSAYYNLHLFVPSNSGHTYSQEVNYSDLNPSPLFEPNPNPLSKPWMKSNAKSSTPSTDSTQSKSSSTYLT